MLASGGLSWTHAVMRGTGTVVSFAKRRPLFALALLGAVRPGDAPRDMLVVRAFGAKCADESHRARPSQGAAEA